MPAQPHLADPGIFAGHWSPCRSLTTLDFTTRNEPPPPDLAVDAFVEERLALQHPPDFSEPPLL
jgi:hypothetical protein